MGGLKMKLRKLFGAAAVSAMALAMAIVPASADGGKVGVCIYKFDDAFMTTYRNALEEMLTEKGYEVSVVDGKNDQAEQNNQINNFITQGVDALIINPVMTSAADQIIDLVKTAGIPTVLINREPTAEQMAVYDKLVYVGCDASQSGTMQGELILDTENKGDINGDGKVSYIMIQGDPENIDAQLRTEYSVKALVDAGVEVEELDLQRGDWDRAKGQEIAQNDLTKFGDEIEVVFSNNDDMAIGALQAIQAAGRTVNEDIYLVGVDALDAALNEVKAGNMTGTVLNDAVGQASGAVEAMEELLGGKTYAEGEQSIYVDYVKVTPENIDEFMN
jgi:methyl-galactoside transport system substrate-binding protein